MLYTISHSIAAGILSAVGVSYDEGFHDDDLGFNAMLHEIGVVYPDLFIKYKHLPWKEYHEAHRKVHHAV